MRLNDIISGNFNAAEWEAKGYELPKFDIKALRERPPRSLHGYISEAVTSSVPSQQLSSTMP